MKLDFLKKLNVFGKMKENKYVENLQTLSKTNLSLLNTMHEMQRAYDEIVDYVGELEEKLRRYEQNKTI